LELTPLSVKETQPAWPKAATMKIYWPLVCYCFQCCL